MPSTTKQVRFDLPIENDFPLDYESITTHLQSVFKQKSLVCKSIMQGLDEEYSELLDLITNHNRLNREQLLQTVRALSLFCTSLDHKVMPLVNAILAIEWIDQETQFINSYLHLLQNIVSAQNAFVTPVCKMILQKIQEKYSSIPNSVLFDRIHAALAKILRLIPSGPSCILPILTQMKPHKSDSLESILFYVKSLLHISDYAAVLSSELVSLVIDLIVQMDIDIQIEDMQEEVDDDEVHIFEMEDIHTITDANDTSSDSDDESILCISSDHKVMIAKLDKVMVLLFDYITIKHQKGLEGQNLSEFSELFNSLLDSFDKTMLPTHRLRCSQFLLFYICSCVPESFPEDFMGLLMTHLMNTSDSNIIRMSSASYLASFIARAQFLDLGSVRHCLKLLNGLCQKYLDNFESEIKTNLEVDRFGVLYSVVQAILYIFCFRWKQIMLDNDKPITGKFPSELHGFQRVLFSKFLPLKVCSEAIVQEFSKIALHLNIMYCFPLANRSDTNSSDGISAYLVRLDAFFPFDPLALPKSKSFITQFQEWEGDDGEQDSELGTSLQAMSSDLGTSIQDMSLDDKMAMSLSVG